jgi:hypothetical protein
MIHQLPHPSENGIDNLLEDRRNTTRPITEYHLYKRLSRWGMGNPAEMFLHSSFLLSGMPIYKGVKIERKHGTM